MKFKTPTSHFLLFHMAIGWAGCLSLFAAEPELKSDLVNRRHAMMEKIGNRGMLILFSGDRRTYSRDINYEFRQESNLYYLTGIRQHGITLVLIPGNSSCREILFLPDRSANKELWTGKMLSATEAAEVSGIQNVWSSSEFEPFIDSVFYGRPYRTSRYSTTTEYSDFFSGLRQGNAEIFLLLESRPGLKGKLSKEYEFSDRLQKRFTGLQIKDASSFFHQLRVIKSPYEISQIRKAIDVTVQAHLEAMKNIRPEMWEYEIEALVEYTFKTHSSDWAFPSIVASGPNATTLHYQSSQKQIHDGELLLMDIGAEYNYYAADITRTVPVNGKFNKQQAEIYQLVLDAQRAALRIIKPGLPISSVHQNAVEVIRKGLFKSGLITSEEGDQYRVFFPHGTRHFLGLDTHDVGHSERLQSGMVITVEPGLYVRDDSLNRLLEKGVTAQQLDTIRRSVEKYKSIGVRIEDDVLVTDEGYELLSKELPREITEIEALMADSGNSR